MSINARMIKALLLILTPLGAWDSAAKRSLPFMVLLYLLPMMLIVGAVEGYGLVEWGRWQSEMVGIKKFVPGEAILSEAGQMLLMALMILISAYFIRALGRNVSYAEHLRAGVDRGDLRIEPDIFAAAVRRDSEHDVVGSVAHRHDVVSKNSLLWRSARDATRSAARIGFIFHERSIARDGDCRGEIYIHRLFDGKIHARFGSRFAHRCQIASDEMKTALEENLLNTLVELDEAVKSMPTANPNQICFRCFRVLKN